MGIYKTVFKSHGKNIPEFKAKFRKKSRKISELKKKNMRKNLRDILSLKKIKKKSWSSKKVRNICTKISDFRGKRNS